MANPRIQIWQSDASDGWWWWRLHETEGITPSPEESLRQSLALLERLGERAESSDDISNPLTDQERR